MLNLALNELRINLCSLIARTSLWADPAVFEALKKVHPHGAWFPNFQRGLKGQLRGTKSGDIVFDDNTRANYAIKLAIFGDSRGCKDFHTCHIWPKSCYNQLYHTSIANLVLVPSALTSLTDFSDRIVGILKYRSFELYGWRPADEPVPELPEEYPSAELWRSPRPAEDKVWRALAARAMGLSPAQSEAP